jgi:DNA-directed RNA polymerase sigma subunit (sigma70/sigma32)
MIFLPLTREEALALGRLLDAIKQGVKEKRSFIRIPLNNYHFTNTLNAIAKKKYSQVLEEPKNEEKKND